MSKNFFSLESFFERTNETNYKVMVSRDNLNNVNRFLICPENDLSNYLDFEVNENTLKIVRTTPIKEEYEQTYQTTIATE